MSQQHDLARLLGDVPRTVAAALAEDVGSGDLTAKLIPADKLARAEVISRDHAICCGRPWADEVFRQVDPAVALSWHKQDGDAITPDEVWFTASGNARSILTAERNALNFMQLLAGTATSVAHHCAQLEGTGAQLLDTRKTIPGLRTAQKYAVRCGGGSNHRLALFDAFLIKENHIAAAGSITAAVQAARKLAPGVDVEVEVETLAQLDESIASGADTVMLDNFDNAQLIAAVKRAAGRVKLEASGGIESLQDVAAIAKTGVDYISVGALTKHVHAVDLSMRFQETGITT